MEISKLVHRIGGSGGGGKKGADDTTK